eukprot:scaffold78140_cov26-Tisochrysis_lutea.AAC.2
MHDEPTTRLAAQVRVAEQRIWAWTAAPVLLPSHLPGGALSSAQSALPCLLYSPSSDDHRNRPLQEPTCPVLPEWRLKYRHPYQGGAGPHPTQHRPLSGKLPPVRTAQEDASRVPCAGSCIAFRARRRALQSKQCCWRARPTHFVATRQPMRMKSQPHWSQRRPIPWSSRTKRLRAGRARQWKPGRPTQMMRRHACPHVQPRGSKRPALTLVEPAPLSVSPPAHSA